MSPLRTATTGATTASASFSSAIGTPNLAIHARAPANTINRCNRAGGNTRHAAHGPPGRSGSNWEELSATEHVFSALPEGNGRTSVPHLHDGWKRQVVAPWR